MKRKITAILLVVALAVSLGVVPAASVGASPDPGLVGLWHFDEGTGTTAYDSSGNGNDGSIVDATWTTSGKFGDALSFDGDGDYVAVGDIDVDGDWTVELWAKLASSSGTIYYPGGLGPAAPNGPGIFMGGTYLSQAWGVYDGTNWVSGSTVSTDTWYHFAVTKSGTTYTLYLDGASDGTGTLADIDISNLNIGKRSDNYWYFDGMIDEVRIWDEALSTGQIGLDLFDVTVNAEGSALAVEIDWSYGEPYVSSADTTDTDTTEFTLESIIEGTEVTLTATEMTVTQDYTFYVFDYWSVNGTDYDDPVVNPVTFDVTADVAAAAHYTKVMSVDKELTDCYLPELIDEVDVPGDGTTVQSDTLESGKSYLFKASGTYTFASWTGTGIADAEYALRPEGSYNPGPGAQWIYGDDVYPPSYPAYSLDIAVDAGNVYWGDFDSGHTYYYLYTGTGAAASFSIYDSAYGDNTGSITVEIYEACDCNAVPLGEVVNFDMTITVHAYEDVTGVNVEDGIGADLAVTEVNGEGAGFPMQPKTEQTVGGVTLAKRGGKMGATKVFWEIGDITGGDVCTDYTLDIVVQTGKNPKDKQEYTSTGEHELNSGPEVWFTYNDTLYMLQGPPVMVTVVGDED